MSAVQKQAFLRPVSTFAVLVLVIGLCVSPVQSLALSVTQLGSTQPRNIVLFYDDYPTRGDPAFQVTREIVKPLVAHLDQNGQPTDWMFDSFIFFSWWLYVNNKPTQKYIDSWITYLFDGKQVANLDSTVAEVKAALAQPDYKMKVFLSVPVPYTAVLRVGTSKNSAIMKNVERLLSAWNALNPSNLELVGFYWGYTESLLLDEVAKAVPSVADYVHSKGLRLLMIPYYNAVGIDRLHQIGVDYVTIQPNFAWNTPDDLTRFKTVNDKIVSGYADGAEFELPGEGDGSLKCCSGNWTANLVTYFDQAYSYGWTTRLTTYYYGSAISLMGRQPSPGYRTAYETIYQYILSAR